MAGIVLREIQESDFEPLSELLVKGFPRISIDKWNQYFDMFWIHNPVFEQVSIPRGWILEDSSRLLGFIGAIPVKFLVHGKESTAVASTSWYVDPVVRGIQSVQLFSSFDHCRNASILLSTTPQKDIRSILEKYQYSRLFIPFNRTDYVHILDSFQTLRLISLNRNKSGDTIAPTPGRGKKNNQTEEEGDLKEASHIPHLMSRIRESYSEELVCSSTSRIDQTFEDLWRSSLGVAACQAELYRDIETMNWLYFSPAVQPKRRVILCRDSNDSSLLGYMAFDRRNPYHGDIPIFEMKDLCMPRYREDVLHALIAYAIGLARKEKVALLACSPSYPQSEWFFDKSFKFRRSAENPYYYYKFVRNSKERQGPETNLTMCPSLIDPDRCCFP